MNRIIFFLFALLISLPLAAASIHVSPRGSDSHSGLQAQPMATLAAALRKARELRRTADTSAANGIHIVMADGEYLLDESVCLRPEDGGTPQSPTTIEAAPNARPVLSGGLRVEKWQLAPRTADLPKAAQGKVWMADVPLLNGRAFDFRQLWVNGRKAQRAQHVGDENMPRIIAWDVAKRECRIPAPAFDLRKATQLEMFILQRWEIAMLRVKSLTVQGAEAVLQLCEPESRIQFEHPWPAPMLSPAGNSAFVLRNAIEFLDTAGEWFLDEQRGKIFYYPQPDEDMQTAVVIAPQLETLLRVEGSLDRPVEHVRIRGISFAHTTWMRPSQMGHVPLQAGMYMLDAYKLQREGLPWDAGLENQAWLGRMSAAVELRCVQHFDIVSCHFSQLAAAALDMVQGVHHVRVERCRFDDIGGSAIVAGHFGEGYGSEAHVPYNPTDKREICHHISIADNRISNAANEDWGCVGIGIGYAHDVHVEHNELSHLPYSGICIGWGWTKHATCLANNRVAGNHVHHFAKKLYAAGGIYTLSAQPNTELCNNHVHHMQLSPYMQEPDYCYYIYLDGASSYITVRNNLCPENKFGQNNPGPGNVWQHNGTAAPDSVRRTAGVRIEDLKI